MPTVSTNCIHQKAVKHKTTDIAKIPDLVNTTPKWSSDYAISPYKDSEAYLWSDPPGQAQAHPAMDPKISHIYVHTPYAGE